MTIVIRAFGPEKAESGASSTLPANPHGATQPHDPNWLMLVPLVLFSVAIVGIGSYPGPLLHLMDAVAAWNW
jgi:formate hydrogenlyase subunit 3/multisubunit Na+/H+ antiporter MnhD subunit